MPGMKHAEAQWQQQQQQQPQALQPMGAPLPPWLLPQQFLAQSPTAAYNKDWVQQQPQLQGKVDEDREGQQSEQWGPSSVPGSVSSASSPASVDVFYKSGGLGLSTPFAAPLYTITGRSAACVRASPRLHLMLVCEHAACARADALALAVLAPLPFCKPCL